jgi:adenosylcobyric acid synthase
MRVAAYAEAAVILVGDIDRGGIFAQMIGTLDLLSPEERQLVRGLIVNRLRGGPSLFEDGVRFLEARTSRPVLGVVPFVRDLGLAEEDGATLDARGFSHQCVTSKSLPHIAIVRLPRIANFDDFGPLERLDGLTVSYVDRPEQLANVDLVILPGSRSTIADLAFIRERSSPTRSYRSISAGCRSLASAGDTRCWDASSTIPNGSSRSVVARLPLGCFPTARYSNARSKQAVFGRA